MKVKLFVFLFISPVLFLTLNSYAQVTLENAVKEVDRPIREEIGKKILPPPPEKPQIEQEEKEKKEEKIEFLAKKIIFTGVKAIDVNLLQPLIEPYENKKITLDDLQKLTKEIEREYLKKGVIAACIVPPQEIKEGEVTLQVIEAKMGALAVKDHKYFRKDRINYYWQLKPGEVLHYDQISRSLQFINKNPDREAKATLHAGQIPETTDILLDVETHLPMHLTGSIDNEGVTSTGKDRFGLGAKHNNFLGLDDTFLFGHTFGRDFNGIYTFHSLPVTKTGASLLYGFNYSKSFPKKEFERYGIDSRAKNSSIFIYQDLFTNDEYSGDIHFGLDVKDKSTNLNTGTINRDRLRIFRLGGTRVQKGFQTVTYIRPEVSQGINGLGALRKNALTSRGAKNTFTKGNLEIVHKRILPFSTQGNFKMKGQVASTKLSPQEQFYLGGIDSVRGYPSGDFLADNAVQGNIEISIPVFFIPPNIPTPFSKNSLKQNTSSILFFDYGYGRRRNSSSTEQPTANFRGVGAGLRIRVFDKALLRLDWGFPIGDDTITESGNSRFHFAFDIES